LMGNLIEVPLFYLYRTKMSRVFVE